MRNLCVVCLGLVIGLVAGCGKKDSSPGANSGVAAQEPMPPPSPRGPIQTTQTPSAPIVVPDSGNANANLEKLTQALRDYVVRTRSVPKDFEEFAAKSQVRFPPPPDGQKYAISGQAVVLVKR